MTLAEVERRLAEIRAAAHDPEEAHCMQDDLFLAVLQHCAVTSPIAKRALDVWEIEFSRWYA